MKRKFAQKGMVYKQPYENEATGNPVILENICSNCVPNVSISFSPIQAGEGNPSPENIRPISGWDSVWVTRCGKNLLDWSKVSAYDNPAYGLSFEKKENSIRVFGTCTQSGGLSFNIAATTQSEPRGKNFIFSWFTSEENVINAYGLRTTSEDTIAIVANLIEGSSYDFTIQIAIGTEKLTSYEPYRGETYTVQLGQTVYGGTVDAVTGVGSKTWGYIASYNGESLPGEWISDRDVYSAGTTPTTGAQVAYKLATPEPFQATDNQPIPALDGVNTLYTNGDEVKFNYTILANPQPCNY